MRTKEGPKKISTLIGLEPREWRGEPGGNKKTDKSEVVDIVCVIVFSWFGKLGSKKSNKKRKGHGIQ